MTDELNKSLDKLKQAFESEPEIRASERAKKTAMASAMQAFEKEHEVVSSKERLKDNIKKTEDNFQGNPVDTRHKDEDRKKAGLFNLFDWRKLMKYNYLFPVAAAGALAVSVLVLNPHLLQKDDAVDAYLADSLKPLAEQKIVKNKSQKQNKDLGIIIADDVSSKAVTMVDGAEADLSMAKEEVAAVAAAPMIAPAKRRLEAKRAPAKKIASGIVLVKPAPQAQLNQSISMYSEPPQMAAAPQGRDKFESVKTNPLKLTENEPVSTFSVDVDTASYSFMRASLNQNHLPQKDAVRVEELINYFPYNYPKPEDKDQPFRVTTTVMPSPWNANNKLLHIGIKGYTLPKTAHPKSNLVFLLDTSGSMNQSNKLPLLINSFKLLLSTLQDDDTVSIVAYAGSAGTVLEPTQVKEKSKIIQALERLRAGGSTAGGEGIRLAYQLAESNSDKNDKNAVNRVLLATDGDFNVGINNPEELKSFIERKRKTGIFLSVLGFGMGNYNDALMQKLAQNGNGNASYIDSLSEARKVLVEEASSTLFTIAKDVKIQMEFNPKVVSQYRLIGYETRALKREDFNNDKVDAGDIGAGHTVTAIYEITPTNAQSKLIDPLRYADESKPKSDDKALAQKASEYGFLRLRYKLPNEDKSKLIESPIKMTDTYENLEKVSTETRFATAVAGFGQLLRGGKYLSSFGYDDVIKQAQSAKGEDVYGYRAEFINLVRLAKTADTMR